MTTLQASAQKQLQQLIEQIERLEEEKKALSGDIRDKFAEAKGLGFDVKVMRKVISLRRKTSTEREEEESSSPSTCTRSACSPTRRRSRCRSTCSTRRSELASDPPGYGIHTSRDARSNAGIGWAFPLRLTPPLSPDPNTHQAEGDPG